MSQMTCRRCGAVSSEPICGNCISYILDYQPLSLLTSVVRGPSPIMDLRRAASLVASAQPDNPPEVCDGPAPSSRNESRVRSYLRSLAVFARDDGGFTLSEEDVDFLHSVLKRERLSHPYGAETIQLLSPVMDHVARVRESAVMRKEGTEARLEEVAEAEVEEIAPAEEPSPPAGTVTEGEEITPPPEVQPTLEEEFPELAELIKEAEAPPPQETIAGSPEPASELEREGDAQRKDLEEWIAREKELLERRRHEVDTREEALKEREAQLRGIESELLERLEKAEKERKHAELLAFLASMEGLTRDAIDVISEKFEDVDALRSTNPSRIRSMVGLSERDADVLLGVLHPEIVQEVQKESELREKAQALMEEGDLEGSLKVFEELLSRDPTKAEYWFDKAEVLRMLNRSEDALKAYNRCLDLDPNNVSAMSERAEILFDSGRVQQALESLRKLISISPTKLSDVLDRAGTLRVGGKLEDSILLYNVILENNPEHVGALLGLGDSLYEKGDIEAADACYSKALSKDPQNPSVLHRKARVLNKKGRWGAAVQLLNRSISVEWTFLDAWLDKGDILLKQNRAPEALECFEKALEVNPRSARAWLGKAQALTSMGEREKAREAASRAEALEPSNSQVREVAGELAGSKELTAMIETLEDLQKLSETGQEDLGSLIKMGEFLLDSGNFQAAVAKFDKTLQVEPRNADAWFGKGRALQGLERLEDALVCYDRAINLNPSHEMAKRWRDTCMKRRGKKS